MSTLDNPEGQQPAASETERGLEEGVNKEPSVDPSARMLTHEIRNLLGVMKNSALYLGMKLQDHPDPKVGRHLELLKQQIERGERLSSDVLILGREAKANPVPTNINELVEKHVESLGQVEGISIKTELGEVPVIETDPDHLNQVVTNITKNAIEAMQKEGGELTLSTNQEGEWVVLHIKDTGPGIPPENLDRIFEPNFTSGKKNGSGLGLAISRKLLRANGGDITVESEVGEGTTFIVRLPLFPPQQEAQLEAPEAP